MKPKGARFVEYVRYWPYVWLASTPKAAVTPFRRMDDVKD